MSRVEEEWEVEVRPGRCGLKGERISKSDSSEVILGSLLLVISSRLFPIFVNVRSLFGHTRGGCYWRESEVAIEVIGNPTMNRVSGEILRRYIRSIRRLYKKSL